MSAAQLPSGYDPALFNATLTWMEYLNRLLGVVVGLLIVLRDGSGDRSSDPVWSPGWSRPTCS